MTTASAPVAALMLAPLSASRAATLSAGHSPPVVLQILNTALFRGASRQPDLTKGVLASHVGQVNLLSGDDVLRLGLGHVLPKGHGLLGVSGSRPEPNTCWPRATKLVQCL